MNALEILNNIFKKFAVNNNKLIISEMADCEISSEISKKSS